VRVNRGISRQHKIEAVLRNTRWWKLLDAVSTPNLESFAC